ncbi:hypothetical protein Aple_021320 [Acrocarpospora pleiomorpha]|uniref:Uncharacterized protein n=1 Tax=Acrocarpospora pleiomorpha TaxID=90975 RepID=A0A5M3XF13_9ACTN|nr:hypothetical protein Aple_021320 [Acrocarpospora pleiomorpha]
MPLIRSRTSVASNSAGPSGETSAVTALGQPAACSASIPTAEQSCPDVQYPHWKPSSLMNAC